MATSEETTLYLLLVNGASFLLGVIAGMFAFNHKTDKTSFQIKIAVAMVLVFPILIYLLL